MNRGLLGILCFGEDSEFAEFVSLLQLLNNKQPTAHKDIFIWNLESSGLFTTSSLTSDLSTALLNEAAPLYKSIWSDHYPKKIKLFRWEVSLNATNTQDKLQRRVSYIQISPRWCILCKEKGELQGHLFTRCSYSTKFWNKILSSFGW